LLSWSLQSPNNTLQAADELLPSVACILHGETSSEEVFWQRHDGSRVRIRITAAPVRDPDHTIIGGVTAIEDLDGKESASPALQPSKKITS
jgi:hypothetical protein